MRSEEFSWFRGLEGSLGTRGEKDGSLGARG
jgi:hypothetical protein